MNQEVITCSRCNGTGHTPLDYTFSDTLAALREGFPATSSEVHARMARRSYVCGLAATINQLAKLVKLGFARREGKRGKSWLYIPEIVERPISEHPNFAALAERYPDEFKAFLSQATKL